jgi:transcriptional antiterminator RfaH
VSANLAAQGFRTFLPQLVREDVSPVVIGPLFPRYLFVEFSVVTDEWRAITSTRGVQTLFSSSALSPTPVPRGVVEDLLVKGTSRVESPAKMKLSVGMPLRVITGPLAGHTGYCSWSGEKRVGLLLDLMQGRIGVTMQRNAVEMAT